MLDNCKASSAKVQRRRGCSMTGLRTLMRNPLARLDRLGSRTQCHEVSFDDMLGVGWVDPKGKRLGQVVGLQGVLTGAHHADGLGEGWRSRQRRQLGGQVKSGWIAGDLAAQRRAGRGELAVVRWRDGTARTRLRGTPKTSVATIPWEGSARKGETSSRDQTLGR